MLRRRAQAGNLKIGIVKTKLSSVFPSFYLVLLTMNFVTLLPRTQLSRSVSINVDKTRKHFPQKFMERACFPNARSFPYGKHCFQCQSLFSRCKLCLGYTAGNFNENPSMRALAKFCDHEQASTHLIFASNSSKGQILRALSNWMGPFDTPIYDAFCRYTVP